MQQSLLCFYKFFEYPILARRLFAFSKNNLTESSTLVINLLPKVFALLNLSETALLFACELHTMFPHALDCVHI